MSVGFWMFKKVERELTIEGLEVVEGRSGRHGSCLQCWWWWGPGVKERSGFTNTSDKWLLWVSIYCLKKRSRSLH
jgi:hypothetical protein